MSDNPKNDQYADWPEEAEFNSGGVVSFDPSGPSTDFGLGKNIKSFTDSIGGCDMDFAQTAERGYAYKADDARDVEIKIIVKAEDIGDDGISVSACTGHHKASDRSCCQGFAYMIDTNMNENPSSFRFRKEMWHVSYHNSPLGVFTDPICNFKINNLGRYVGLGFCRYNDPQDIDGTVVVECWFNPDPDSSKTNWKMIKRFKDTHGAGWGNDGDDCGGFSDQPGTWSNAQNRVKTNANNGTFSFKQVSIREIDPSGDFGTGPDPNPPPPVPPTEPLKYTFSFKFGTDGTGNGEFKDPHDITFDSTGDNMWICDRIRNDVQKFTKQGVYLSKFAGPGSGDGELNVPYVISIDPTFTYLYICDRENNRVQKLTTTGTFVSKITSAGGKSLKKPEDICFNPTNGDIFICDTGNNRVIKLNSAHTFITQWDGSAAGQEFNHPHSMDITTDNNYICINCGNQPFITKWTTSGTFVKKWGSEGNGPGQVRMFLEHMDIDAFGRLHLCNNDVRPVINVWDQEGNWLCHYGNTKSGSADGQFREPEHVTVHPNGNPYVVDAKNQRIQVFTPNFTTPPDPDDPPPPPPPPTGGGGGGTSKITGSFTLLRDINIGRVSACQGSDVSEPGGGSGGTTQFYGSGVTPDNETKLSDSSTWSHRTRHAQKVGTSSSVMKGKVIKQINPSLMRTGSPAATPTISAYIWNSAGAIMATSSTTLDPSTLPTSIPADSSTWPAFDFSSNTYALQVGDKVGIVYEGTSDTNYIRTGYESDPGEGSHWVMQMEGGTWEEKKTRDWAVLLWQ